jgi:hypothetical protein
VENKGRKLLAHVIRSTPDLNVFPVGDRNELSIRTEFDGSYLALELKAVQSDTAAEVNEKGVVLDVDY